MYLGISPVVSNWSAAGDEFSLLIENNPLTDFVELPEGHNALNYSTMLCGVLKGALQMVSTRTLDTRTQTYVHTHAHIHTFAHTHTHTCARTPLSCMYMYLLHFLFV
jgi:hypothetical protein